VSPIFLTGLMGSGKTTVGRELAARVGAVFVDLDDRIERMFGRTIAELFATGEPSFRACEHAALVALLTEPAFAQREVVVATGGGVVLDPRHRDAMAACGHIVWLHCDVATLVARLADGGEARPLLAHGDVGARLAALASERDAVYRDRAVEIDGAASPSIVADRVLAHLVGARP
jgi:shikimate kinase